MTAENQNFEMYQGETKHLYIKVVDGDGNLINLTSGVVVKWGVKKAHYADRFLISKETGGGIEIRNGVAIVMIEPDDTEGLIGEYQHEARLIDEFENVSTILTGVVVVKGSVFT